MVCCTSKWSLIPLIVHRRAIIPRFTSCITNSDKHCYNTPTVKLNKRKSNIINTILLWWIVILIFNYRLVIGTCSISKRYVIGIGVVHNERRPVINRFSGFHVFFWYFRFWCWYSKCDGEQKYDDTEKLKKKYFDLYII